MEPEPQALVVLSLLLAVDHAAVLTWAWSSTATSCDCTAAFGSMTSIPPHGTHMREDATLDESEKSKGEGTHAKP